MLKSKVTILECFHILLGVLFILLNAAYKYTKSLASPKLAGNSRRSVAVAMNKEHDRFTACCGLLDHRKLQLGLGALSVFPLLAALLYLRAASAPRLFFTLLRGLGENLRCFPFDRR